MESFSKTSASFKAQLAGVSYLLGSLLSLFGQFVVLDKIVVYDNAAATAANILGHESMFRLGFVSSFMSVLFHFIWAALFYALFKPVSRTLSLLAVFIMLAACSMWSLSAFFHLAPLSILKGSSQLSAFSPEQLQSLGLIFLKLNVKAYDLGLIFFGLWCIVIGYLISKSTFIPRIIGILQMFAGLGYLIPLWQPLVHYFYPYNLALAGPGEISLMLWLLIKGVKNNISTIDKQ